MGRHTQLDRPVALEDPRGAPSPPAADPAGVVGGPADPGRPAVLGWGATARAILPAFLLTRVVVLVAAVVGAALWGVHDASDVYDPAGLTTGLGAVGDRLVSPFARWDAVWFLDIANNGYPTTYEPRTAFFPLYPGILRVGDLLGSAVLVGILVSSACTFLAAMALHRLTELELGRPAAGVAVWALFVFPGSLWLTAVYSEGLFLALSVGCLYGARERRWALVAVLGALAATTRSAGVVLAVPVVVMAWQQRPDGTTVRELLRPAVVAAMRPAALAAAAIVGGLLLYVLGLWAAGHSLTVSFDQQQEWGRRNVGPFQGTYEAFVAAADGLDQIFGSAPTPAASTPNADWMNPLLFVFLLAGGAALVGAARRLPPAYAAYAGCALLLPLSAPALAGGEPLMSLPRFLGVLFPLAMWMGWWLTRGPLQRARRSVLLVVGLGLLALFSELTARWLFVA